MFGKRNILEGWPLSQEEVDALPKIVAKPNPTNVLDLETRVFRDSDGKEIDIFSTVETLDPTTQEKIMPAHRLSVINNDKEGKETNYGKNSNS